ncbi:MAG: hypothetical protein AAF921_06505 [Cyanobacteria bacterium P01_D01_bin.44]
MSASPFTTLEEFNGAIDGPTGGAIYTFANTPAINNIALLVSVGLFIWFIARTYAPHHNLPTVDRSLNSLAMFIVAGLFSLIVADYQHRPQTEHSAQRSGTPSRLSHQSKRVPLGLLGLTSLGMPTFRRAKNKRRWKAKRSPMNR